MSAPVVVTSRLEGVKRYAHLLSGHTGKSVHKMQENEELILLLQQMSILVQPTERILKCRFVRHVTNAMNKLHCT